MIIFFPLVVLQAVFSKRSMHIMLLTISTEEAYNETSAHIANAVANFLFHRRFCCFLITFQQFMNRVILAILKWSLIICSLQVSVISLKLRICTASNIREVRISQLLIDLLPVLKRFLSQTINGPECETARTAERYERWYRWEWAIQRYHNFGVNIFRKMQCREQLMFPTHAHLSWCQPCPCLTFPLSAPIRHYY